PAAEILRAELALARQAAGRLRPPHRDRTAELAERVLRRAQRAGGVGPAVDLCGNDHGLSGKDRETRAAGTYTVRARSATGPGTAGGQKSIAGAVHWIWVLSCPTVTD